MWVLCGGVVRKGCGMCRVFMCRWSRGRVVRGVHVVRSVLVIVRLRWRLVCRF